MQFSGFKGQCVVVKDSVWCLKNGRAAIGKGSAESISERSASVALNYSS